MQQHMRHSSSLGQNTGLSRSVCFFPTDNDSPESQAEKGLSQHLKCCNRSCPGYVHTNVLMLGNYTKCN